MTKKETAQIIFILKEFYPQSFENSDLNNRVTAWHMVLKDFDYNEVQAAVLGFVATDRKGFMPSVGQLIDKLNGLKAGDEMTELEAWALVQRACSNSTYNAEREFKKLPPVIQRLVGSPSQLKEWGQMPSDTFNSVIQSNFLRSYRARAASEREYLALPESVKQMLLPVSDALKLDGRLVQDEAERQTAKQIAMRRLAEYKEG